MFLAYCLLLFLTETKALLDTINSSQSITDNGNTLVSAGGIFELRFFSPGNSKYRFLGIWYKQPSASAVVWVANRETPLRERSGILRINHHGSLLLEDGRNITVWSTNHTRSSQNPVLQLLDSGNLVIRDLNDSTSDNYLWQSFDFPCDTLLPEMKIGRNFSSGLDRFLTAWKSADDPAPGQISLWIDPSGFPQLILRNGSLKFYRLGSWNGLRFTGTPDLPMLQYWKYDFQLNKKEVYYSYEVQGLLMTRVVVNESGLVQRFVHTEKSNGWTSVYHNAPQDQCDHYSACGAYMNCKITDNSPSCACLEGFVLNSQQDESKGCIRNSRLDCINDFFQNYTGLKLPDTSLSKFYNISLHECKETCLGNCSCTAYAASDIRTSSGCLLWYGDLMDMRAYGSGQDLFIRLSTSKADQNSRTSKKKVVGLTVGVAALVGLLIISVCVYLWNKKRRSYLEDIELPIFDLNTIVKATDNFSSSNKLGQGGFGPVHKGTMPDKQEIAVKRLSKSSGQGITEFKNEVILIAKLQHRNLVKLLGCCIQGDEKMLIYEFMPNKSLDFFIFDPIRSKMIDWHKRFLIIGGIARGLLYLHQDSRLRIIHRDLKASNVLLDKDMNPKISDFGLARMVGGDQTGANTNKVVGTYGYMSPEYAVDGLFSIKSDVFSFGVLVLEIICGKKNRGFSHPDHRLNLLGHAWKWWTEGRSLELIDNVLSESYSVSEALRCIHLGLLCVQQRPEDRPDMSSVVLMLGSENPLPQPKQPGFYLERNMPEEESVVSGKQESSSTNEITFSTLEPR